MPVKNIAQKKDVYKIIWNELEDFLRVNHDKSERHKAIYNHVKKLRVNFIKNEPKSQIQYGIKSEKMDTFMDAEVNYDL